VVEELGQMFQSSGVVVVARYEGMTVAQMQELRAQMREVGGSVRVAKNRLAKIALKGQPAESVAALLTGMTVFACSEDPVAAAKVSDAFAKTNEKFVILGGAMGETALGRGQGRGADAQPRGAYRFHRGQHRRSGGEPCRCHWRARREYRFDPLDHRGQGGLSN